MNKILLVEDNPNYSRPAVETLKSSGYDAHLVRDYFGAAQLIEDSRISAVITDCFFPEAIGSGKRDLGMKVVQMMLDSDPRGRKKGPVALSIEKVGRLLGLAVAKRITNNTGANYSQEVDNYWALEQAIKEDEANQPLGVMIATRAEELNLPFIIATSTYHHDELTQPVCDYAGRKDWKVVDCNPCFQEEKSTPEFWERALIELKKRMK